MLLALDFIITAFWHLKNFMQYCKTKIPFSGNEFETNLNVCDTVSRLVNCQMESKFRILLTLKTNKNGTTSKTNRHISKYTKTFRKTHFSINCINQGVPKCVCACFKRSLLMRQAFNGESMECHDSFSTQSVT